MVVVFRPLLAIDESLYGAGYQDLDLARRLEALVAHRFGKDMVATPSFFKQMCHETGGDMFRAGVRYQGFELLSPKRSRTTNSVRWIVSRKTVDPTERDQFRSWGQMDGPNKQLATIAMQRPEGWERNQGWGVG